MTLTSTPVSRPIPRAASRRLTGAAALGYVVAAGVENMELLGTPLPGADAADIRAAYADQALLTVTTAAGAISLLLYVVFATRLVAALREGSRGGWVRGDGWATAALAGGIAGPVLAAAGLAAHATLVASGGDAPTALFELQANARLVAGAFMALFLLGAGIAGHRTGALPPVLCRLACAAAVPLALGPVAALTGAHALQVAVIVAFGVHALWVWLAGLWLLAGGAPAVVVVRRAAFLMLVVAAGLVGLALLIVPGATGSFFAWGLEPEPLAAFAGGVYAGSAALYIAALRAPAPGLVAGAVALSVSVLAITLAHLDVFDFGRLQAWAWMALFTAFAAVTCALAALDRARPPAPRVSPPVRAALAAVALTLGTLGAALWIDPAAVPAPVELPPLGGRFAGSWIVLPAVIAGYAAATGRADDARLAALALVALSAGALVAAARTFGDLDGGGMYVAAVAALLATGVALLSALRARGTVTTAG